MAVGSRPPRLSTGASPKGCLNILTIWPLASSRTNDPGEQDASHNVFFKKQCYLCILSMLSLCCCTGFSLVVEGAGAALWLWGTGFSLQWPLLLRSTGPRAHGLQWLRHVGSLVVQGLSCSGAHGIFADQVSNLCLLHGQAYSSSLSHQGSHIMSFMT